MPSGQQLTVLTAVMVDVEAAQLCVYLAMLSSPENVIGKHCAQPLIS